MNESNFLIQVFNQIGFIIAMLVMMTPFMFVFYIAHEMLKMNEQSIKDIEERRKKYEAWRSTLPPEEKAIQDQKVAKQRAIADEQRQQEQLDEDDFFFNFLDDHHRK